MVEWQRVRFDPEYPEPIEPEIMPLCDALNAAGFATTASCCGHGWDRPRVWFEHSADARIESLARHILAQEQTPNQRYYSVFRKEIHIDGYSWSLEVHLNYVFGTTPIPEAEKEADTALAQITRQVGEWASSTNPS
jgi:hypothetical protein